MWSTIVDAAMAIWVISKSGQPSVFYYLWQKLVKPFNKKPGHKCSRWSFSQQ